MVSTHSNEVQETKKQFLIMITGEYLITGFFWVFITLGSLSLSERKADTFFFSLFVLMISNGIWEILTGWYADKFKRQVSMSAGFLACLAGFCLMGLAPRFPGDFESVFSYKSLVWNAGINIWSLGPALLSGAREAWLVDRCNFFSQKPPEDVSDIFKKAAGYGILAKSIGALVCFLIFWYFSNSNARLPFLLSAAIAASLSGALLYHSLRLREEYWSHPKYQTSESLFSFLRKGLEDLWRTPYRWFTLSYVGAMSLNYVLSPTIWPYMVGVKERESWSWAGILILAELLGSFLSRPFSKWIDLIKQHQLRMPVAAMMYLTPVLLLWILGRGDFLYILIGAAFLFRTVNASVFGTLNTIGQLAIKSDERRALLFSISSAFSSFAMAIVFLMFFGLSFSSTERSLVDHIERFWSYVPVFCILMLIVGGYLMARPRSGAR